MKRKMKEEKREKIKNNWKVLIASFLIVFLVAYLGSLFTNNAVKSDWYESIKSGITPPNFVFPIAWSIIFFMIALSLYFSWISADKEGRKNIAFAFGINFLLNMLWSVLYFGLKIPKASFVEIIFLWLSILSMILVTRKIDKKAAWLLVPYLLWTAFASILNFLSF